MARDYPPIAARGDRTEHDLKRNAIFGMRPGAPFKLYPYQQAILDRVSEDRPVVFGADYGREPSRTCILRSRQCGKSLLQKSLVEQLLRSHEETPTMGIHTLHRDGDAIKVMETIHTDAVTGEGRVALIVRSDRYAGSGDGGEIVSTHDAEEWENDAALRRKAYRKAFAILADRHLAASENAREMRNAQARDEQHQAEVDEAVNRVTRRYLDAE